MTAYWRKTLLVGGLYGSASIFVLFFFFPANPSPLLPVLGAIIFVLSFSFYQISMASFRAFLPVISRTLSLDEPHSVDSERALPSNTPVQSSATLSSETTPLLGRLHDGSPDVAEDTGPKRSSEQAAMMMGRISSHEQAIMVVAVSVVLLAIQYLIRQGVSLTVLEGECRLGHRDF